MHGTYAYLHPIKEQHGTCSRFLALPLLPGCLVTLVAVAQSYKCLCYVKLRTVLVIQLTPVLCELVCGPDLFVKPPFRILHGHEL